MQRNACLTVLTLMLVPMVGCSLFQKKGKPMADVDSPGGNTAAAYDDPYVAQVTPTGESSYASYDPYQAYGSELGASTPEASYAASAYETPASGASLTARTSSPQGGRYHSVAKGDTLFSLARQYYNDQRKWKTIYEANLNQITDPNRIMVGQKLVIP